MLEVDVKKGCMGDVRVVSMVDMLVECWRRVRGMLSSQIVLTYREALR